MKKVPKLRTVNVNQVQRRVNKLIDASIAYSWKGARPVSEHAQIEQDLNEAAVRFMEALEGVGVIGGRGRGKLKAAR